MDNENNNNVEQNVDVPEAKTYTEEEVQALLQSEGDRRVTEALKKRDKKDKASLEVLNKERQETKDKDDRIADLEKRLNDYEALQQKTEIMSVLAERKLDSRFIDVINIGADAEENLEVIDKLQNIIKAQVDSEVKARLAATGTTIVDGQRVESMTKEEFDKLTLAQQAEIFKTRPELYKKFTN